MYISVAVLIKHIRKGVMSLFRGVVLLKIESGIPKYRYGTVRTLFHPTPGSRLVHMVQSQAHAHSHRVASNVVDPKLFFLDSYPALELISVGSGLLCSMLIKIKIVDVILFVLEAQSRQNFVTTHCTY
jgi:hypothetical protein